MNPGFFGGGCAEPIRGGAAPTDDVQNFQEKNCMYLKKKFVRGWGRGGFSLDQQLDLNPQSKNIAA